MYIFQKVLRSANDQYIMLIQYNHQPYLILEIAIQKQSVHLIIHHRFENRLHAVKFFVEMTLQQRFAGWTPVALDALQLQLHINRHAVHSCCFVAEKLALQQARSPMGEARLKDLLRSAIMRRIRQGYTKFICRLDRAPDALFSEVVLSLQRQYPDIRLIACLAQKECGLFDRRQSCAAQAMQALIDGRYVIENRSGTGEEKTAALDLMISFADSIILLYQDLREDRMRRCLKNALQQEKNIAFLGAKGGTLRELKTTDIHYKKFKIPAPNTQE